MGLYDFEQQINRYQMGDPTSQQTPRAKHPHILGVFRPWHYNVTPILYWMEVYYELNDWSIWGEYWILTAPRLVLAIDLVDRLKGIFTNNGFGGFEV